MIIGKRVRLRALEREDLPRFVLWLNDPDVYEHLPRYLPLSTVEEEKWFEEVQTRPPDERPLAIEINTEEGWMLVGNTGFFHLDLRQRNAEVGILIGEKLLWNQGIGTEAMQLMLRHGFMNLNLNRIYLLVSENNLRGIKSYEKAGFIHEGKMREACFTNGRYIDILIMGILRSEWQDKEE